MSKYLIVLSESSSFPWGMAAATRVRNLCKALLQQDWSVEYFGLRGANVQRKKGKKYPPSGKEFGINYCYPGRIPTRNSNWWLRRFDDFISWLLTLLKLLARKLLGRVDIVLIYSRNKNVTGFWIPFLHFLKIPVIMEVCEWPLAIAKVKGDGYRSAQRFCRNILSADGVLPISSYIDNEIAILAKAKGRKLPSFRVPILIDIEEVRNLKTEASEKAEYMLYCGDISYMDIARIIVDIVYRLKIKGSHLPVIFTGNTNNPGFKELRKYAEKRDVLDSFEFPGFIEESELHRLMRKATCLLAPLPENLQSESRFSTKIGYYLASGVPVVTTGVGDVKLYLKDLKSAFITINSDPEQYAEKIEQILAEPDVARKVGLAGRELALERFHFSHACDGLGDFINHVVNGYHKK